MGPLITIGHTTYLGEDPIPKASQYSSNYCGFGIGVLCLVLVLIRGEFVIHSIIVPKMLVLQDPSGSI